MNYDALLDKAIKELPDVLKEHSRFEKPSVESIIQGKTTFVKNLGEVAKAINRKTDLIAKYLIKELGTAGTHDAQHLTLKGQFREPQIQEKFDAFLEEFVLCSECARPDTKILREERINFLVCEACGARRSIGSIKASVQKDVKKELAIGDEITVEITKIGRKGDGLAKIGNYLVFVTGARIGQKVKARITGIQNTMIFAVTIEVI
ncbi:translation initiation factor IF-2 subunit beta [archaeon]|nr:translation initiation factor IF-2 subunit beta [archaeon]